MKAWAWVFGFLAGITAILACVPPTSWAMQNQVGIFQGKLRQEETDAYPAGYILELPAVPLNGSFERQLVSLLWGDKPDHPERVLRLVEQNDGRALSWAIAVRTLLAHASLPSPPYGNGENVYPARPEDRDIYALRQQRFAEAVQAAAKGQALDPSNAFFPLCQAIGYFGMGMKPQYDDALRRAAACPTFNSYTVEQADVQERVGLSLHGYRGVLYRLNERETREHSLMISIGYLGGWLKFDQAPNANRVLIDYLKVLRKIYLTTTDTSEYRTAGGMIRSPFRPPSSLLVKSGDRSQLVARARMFVAGLSPEDRRALDFDVPSFVFSVDSASRFAIQRTVGLTEPNWWYQTSEPGESTDVAFHIMVAAILLLLVAAMAWGMSKLPEKAALGAAAPLLATGAYGIVDCFFVGNMSDSQFIAPLAGIYLALGVLAFFERFRSLAYVLGFAAPFVAIALHLPDVMRRGDGPFEAVPFGVFLLFLGRGRWLKWRGAPKRMSLVVLGVTLLVGWYVAFATGADFDSPGTFGFFAWKYMVFLLVLVCALAVAWQGGSFRVTGQQWLRAIPALGAIVWVAYLLALAFDVHEDNRFGTTWAALENEASATREAERLGQLLPQNRIVIPNEPQKSLP